MVVLSGFQRFMIVVLSGIFYGFESGLFTKQVTFVGIKPTIQR